MAFMNLTRHNINIVGIDTPILPSGTEARVSTTSIQVGEHGGVPLYRTVFGEVVDLPDPVEGVLYIVSGLVRSAVPHRADVVSPGDPVRDAEGIVRGARGLNVNG